MDNLYKLSWYAQPIMILILSILAVILISGFKNITGKKWLIGFIVISLVCFLIYRFKMNQDDYRWRLIHDLLYCLGMACFGIFLFVNWCKARMNLNMKDILFSYHGRIPRSVFWICICIFTPLNAAIYAPLSTLMERFSFLPVLKIVSWIVFWGWYFLNIWIQFAIYTKRWHDCSKSGWMSLILLIPVIGIFWFLGYLGFVRGTNGPNQYGDDFLDMQMKGQNNITESINDARNKIEER
jgi:uncharacterized membrane protein YhaH (DUF805 family)